MEQFNEDTTLEYFMENKEKFILPLDETPTDEQILSLLNNAAVYNDFFWNGEVDGIPFPMAALKLLQNNPFHIEGPVVNHVALGHYRLRFMADELTAQEYEILERAMFWSDLGKLATAKPHKSKTWDNGESWTACNGHAEKSVEILDDAMGKNLFTKGENPPWWYEPVRWLVAEHMNAHKLEEFKERTVVPDFLAPQIQGLEPWEFPEWDDLEIPHEAGKSFSKRGHYNWIKRNHKLLIIKQKLDEDGRISDLSFSL
ncbi:hypothetical protein N9X64_00010 [bacterium]|nr:hypothetical protein [bacterium]